MSVAWRKGTQEAPGSSEPSLQVDRWLLWEPAGWGRSGGASAVSGTGTEVPTTGGGAPRVFVSDLRTEHGAQRVRSCRFPVAIALCGGYSVITVEREVRWRLHLLLR